MLQELFVDGKNFFLENLREFMTKNISSITDNPEIYRAFDSSMAFFDTKLTVCYTFKNIWKFIK